MHLSNTNYCRNQEKEKKQLKRSTTKKWRFYFIELHSFTQIVKPTFEKKEPEAVEVTEDNEVMRLSVEELDLPTRIANALRKGGYATVKDLVQATRQDIAKVKNLGEKSLDIIVKKLKNKDIAIKE